MSTQGGVRDGSTGARAEGREAPGDGAYAARSVLDDVTLEALMQANASFLALIAGAATPGALGLAADAAAVVRGLAAESRDFAAAVPFTLFNLRFEDVGFWRDASLRETAPGAPVAARAPPPPQATAPEPGTVAFAHTAVCFAWHLARQGEAVAAVALGIAPDGREAWRRLPFAALHRAAAAAAPRLQARFGGHPRFWPLLVQAAVGRDDAALQRVRLLGLQLLASEGRDATFRPRARR